MFSSTFNIYFVLWCLGAVSRPKLPRVRDPVDVIFGIDVLVGVVWPDVGLGAVVRRETCQTDGCLVLDTAGVGLRLPHTMELPELKFPLPRRVRAKGSAFR